MMKHRRRMLLNLQKENLMKYAVFVRFLYVGQNQLSMAPSPNGSFYIEIQGGKTYKIRKKQIVGSAFRVAFTIDFPQASVKTYGYVNNSATQDVPLIVTAPTNCNYLVIRGFDGSTDGDIYRQLQNEILEVTEV